MRQFAGSYPDDNWAAVAAQIPWGHNMILLDMVDTVEKRLWYVQQTLENGWSRAMLVYCQVIYHAISLDKTLVLNRFLLQNAVYFARFLLDQFKEIFG